MTNTLKITSKRQPETNPDAVSPITPSANGERKPLFSILMPVVKTKYFTEAFDSATRQTFDDYEIVVLNNKADSDISWVRENKKVRYYENEERLPIVENMNKGIGLLRGEYATILSDDDILYENFLKETDRFLKENDVDVVRIPRKEINELGEVVAYSCPGFPVESFAEYVYYQFCFSRGQALSDYVFHRKTALEVGGANTKLPSGWVFDLSLLLDICARRNKIGNLNSTQMCYRHQSSGNFTSSGGGERFVHRVMENFYIYKQIENILEKTHDEYTQLALSENKRRFFMQQQGYYEVLFRDNGLRGVICFHRDLPPELRRKNFFAFLLRRSFGRGLNIIFACLSRASHFFKSH